MLAIKRLVIVAGEESGDAHAASFVRQLKDKHPHLEVSGIGGQHMKNAGVHLLSDLAKHGVTGLSEVLKHFRSIKKAFNDIKKHLTENKPDLLVLVDYPGFNLRLAKFAKKTLGIRILYYVSPQIWAWKAGRIHLIRECVDRMAVILPFETQIYKNAQVPVTFVGHPLVEKLKNYDDIPGLKRELNLPLDKRIIALLPGSRTNEIDKLMPVLKETAVQLHSQCNDLHFVIPVAGTLNPETINAYLKNTPISYTLISSQAVEAMSCSSFVIVASGTASLECALLEKPMCIIYKGSFLTYLVASMVINVKYLGLCNLLENKMIVPELLQYDCVPSELSPLILKFLNDKELSLSMENRLRQLKKSLSIQQGDCTITQLIEREIQL